MTLPLETISAIRRLLNSDMVRLTGKDRLAFNKIELDLDREEKEIRSNGKDLIKEEST